MTLRQRTMEHLQVRKLCRGLEASYVQEVSLFARHSSKLPRNPGPREDLFLPSLADERKEAGSQFHPHRRHSLPSKVTLPKNWSFENVFTPI